MAWIMPGIKPKIVSKILSQKAGRIPTVRKTPNGGSMMANIIFRMLISLDLINSTKLVDSIRIQRQII